MTLAKTYTAIIVACFKKAISYLWQLIVFSCDICFRVFFTSKKTPIARSILLIRLDAIGDYILFRNFIAILADHEKYKEYKIHFLGNKAWREVFEVFDTQYVDRFIFLDRNKFYKNLFYRYKKMKQLSNRGYELVVSPVFSREFFYADSIIACTSATKKIGSIGDYSNIECRWMKAISDCYYTHLIYANNDLMFEFNRNLEFFEGFLECKLSLTKPFLMPVKHLHSFELPKKYAVIFIGASSKIKKWNIKNFVEVGHYLKTCHGFEIVLCGGPGDISDSLKFESNFKGHVFNLVGKTTLIDLIEIISSAQILVSNETSAPHFAVALDATEVFVVYNGNHLSRFTPYPEKMTNKYHVVYHPEIENNLQAYQQLSNNFGYGSKLNIDDISADALIKKIAQVLDSAQTTPVSTESTYWGESHSVERSG